MKTGSELDREIARELGGRAIAANTELVYERIKPNGSMSTTERRWIGRCKTCGRTHRLDGRIMLGLRGTQGDLVIQGNDDRVYTTADMGSNPALVRVRCGDHYCKLERVTEGTKRSKHECGARCTNAVGPSCDCKCKGKNHGSGIAP